MDETPVTFDLPNAVTLDECGAKTISIRTTGHEKSNFTVILGCLADGTKLLAACIFKLKNMPCQQFPPGIYIRVNEKGWYNEQEMICKNITDMAVIPGGLTTNEVHELTPSGRIKQPSYSLMATWLFGISSDQDVNIDQQYKMETEDYIDELANNIELIDLTNEKPVW
ncbi:11198_t:CDS:2, partial [Racocetra persica]